MALHKAGLDCPRCVRGSMFWGRDQMQAMSVLSCLQCGFIHLYRHADGETIHAGVTPLVHMARMIVHSRFIEAEAA